MNEIDDILNIDNSMFFDIDSQSFNETVNQSHQTILENNSRKRKSGDKNVNLFKVPVVPKKIKLNESKTNKNPHSKTQRKHEKVKDNKNTETFDDLTDYTQDLLMQICDKLENSNNIKKTENEARTSSENPTKNLKCETIVKDNKNTETFDDLTVYTEDLMMQLCDSIENSDKLNESKVNEFSSPRTIEENGDKILQCNNKKTDKIEEDDMTDSTQDLLMKICDSVEKPMKAKLAKQEFDMPIISQSKIPKKEASNKKDSKKFEKVYFDDDLLRICDNVEKLNKLKLIKKDTNRPLQSKIPKKEETLKTVKTIEMEQNPENDLQISTQDFLMQISDKVEKRSQASDCVKQLKKDDNLTFKYNPVTCSQYIQDKNYLNRSTSFNESNNESGRSRKGSVYELPASAIEKCKTPAKYLGPFFGLSSKHKEFLIDLKGIADLYDWQSECLTLDAIDDRTNLIYALPTSGGKTLVAEILMLREIILREMNVIFILPYVSIVQEKVQDLMPLALEYEFLIEEYCAGKGSIPPTKRQKKNSIYICTMEKAQILIDSLIEAKRIGEIGLVVVDELHMIGDQQRGYVLESLLTKIMYLENIPIQIVGMSATIANLGDVAQFLHAHIYTRDFRPVELKEYVKIGTDLLYVDPQSKTISETFKIVRSNIGDDRIQKIGNRDPDHLGVLVEEVISKSSSCLVFCATKKGCENAALLLVDILPNEIKGQKKQEKIDLISAIKSDSNGSICPTLAKTIPFGIAYHHSGLTNYERKHVEEAYRSGVLNVICCTSTLAAGVNLPASRVIIRSPYVGPNFLTLSRYKQMIGRAGRAGKAETGESILFCFQKDYQRLVSMLTSRMDSTTSGFIQSSAPVRTVILNLIGTQLCKTFLDLYEYSKCLLGRVQQQKHNLSMTELFKVATIELLNEGAIIATSSKAKRRSAQKPFFSYMKEGKSCDIYPCDRLQVNKIGKAAVSSGMTLEEAKKVEKDLRKAHENLVLSQCLHLLYIVAPKDAVDSIFLNYKTYNEIFMKMEPAMIHTASIIGISEATAMKMVRNVTFKDEEVLLFKRFYIALILNDLWNGKDMFDVSSLYKVNRGIVHKLMQSASNQAYSLFKFCEVFDEFWVFKEILEKFSKRLSHCCTTEILPLMELPNVKIGRAKMMYAAGIRTICDVAKLSPEELVQAIKNINLKQAQQVIKAANHSIAEKVDTFQSQMMEMMEAVNTKYGKS